MKKLTGILLLIANSLLAQQITWQKYFTGVSLVNAGHSIIEMPDSGFVVAATVFANYPNSITLIGLDKFGDTLWARAYSGAKPEKIIHTKDSGFAIVGGMWGASILIIKLNSLFDTVWTKTYPGFNMSHGYDICETHDNGFVIATQGSFFKVDKSGNFMWDVYMGYCEAVKQGFNGDIASSWQHLQRYRLLYR